MMTFPVYSLEEVDSAIGCNGFEKIESAGSLNLPSAPCHCRHQVLKFSDQSGPVIFYLTDPTFRYYQRDDYVIELMLQIDAPGSNATSCSLVEINFYLLASHDGQQATQLTSSFFGSSVDGVVCGCEVKKLKMPHSILCSVLPSITAHLEGLEGIKPR